MVMAYAVYLTMAPVYVRQVDTQVNIHLYSNVLMYTVVLRVLPFSLSTWDEGVF